MALQSTTLQGTNASRAVDGILNSNWADGSVSLTSNGTKDNPTESWEVDLGEDYFIERIRI